MSGGAGRDMSMHEAAVLLGAAMFEIGEARTRLFAIRDSQISAALGKLTNVKGSGYDISTLREAIAAAEELKKSISAVAAEANNVSNLIDQVIA